MTKTTYELDAKLPEVNGVKKTKTPRNYDSILKGALALDLSDRVILKGKLQESIEKEVKDLKEKAEAAAQIASGQIVTK